MAIEVTVAGLALDEKTKSPIIVLKDETGNNVLPIVIGIMEASSIAAQLEGVDFPRPMTHDLLAQTIQKLGATVDRIEITDIINDTFYANIHLAAGDQAYILDARPSDSIALALRMNARILVDEEVFVKTSKREDATGHEESQALENLEDDDFGKYKM